MGKYVLRFTSKVSTEGESLIKSGKLWSGYCKSTSSLLTKLDCGTVESKAEMLTNTPSSQSMYSPKN